MDACGCAESPAEGDPVRLRRGVFAQTPCARQAAGGPHGRALHQAPRPVHPSQPGTLPVGSITREDVDAWYYALNPTTATYDAHAYALLKGILGSAVEDGHLASNPCAIKGAGNAKRATKTTVGTLAELDAITDAMPGRYRAMVQLAAWCALRFGELIELRRRDVIIKDGTMIISVTRGAVRTEDGYKVGPPKSEAGVRTVHVPPHIVPMIAAHLLEHVQPGQQALLFGAVSGGHLQPSTFNRHWYRARAAAERPDLRFHDLRHTGATMAAQTGATLAELMARVGHSTPQVALRYQHAAAGADARIAEALPALAGAQ